MARTFIRSIWRTQSLGHVRATKQLTHMLTKSAFTNIQLKSLVRVFDIRPPRDVNASHLTFSEAFLCSSFFRYREAMWHEDTNGSQRDFESGPWIYTPKEAYLPSRQTSTASGSKCARMRCDQGPTYQGPLIRCERFGMTALCPSGTPQKSIPDESSDKLRLLGHAIHLGHSCRQFNHFVRRGNHRLKDEDYVLKSKQLSSVRSRESH